MRSFSSRFTCTSSIFLMPDGWRHNGHECVLAADCSSSSSASGGRRAASVSYSQAVSMQPRSKLCLCIATQASQSHGEHVSSPKDTHRTRTEASRGNTGCRSRWSRAGRRAARSQTCGCWAAQRRRPRALAQDEDRRRAIAPWLSLKWMRLLS